jgi:hypothetical protein
MLNFFRNRKIEKRKVELRSHIEESSKWLKQFTSETEAVHENALYEITRIKRNSEQTWKQALNLAEVKENLYKLLLHRQFIGYQAEDLRQKTFELKKLEGLAPNPLNKEEYRDVIELGVCKNEMVKLNNLLAVELMPQLEKFEHDTCS